MKQISCSKTSQHTLFRKSKTLPQTYSIQHKEQIKEKLLSELSGHSWKKSREITLGIRISEQEESLESWIKQELIPALDGAGIRTFVIGENTFKSKFKHITFVPEERTKDVWTACDLFIWPKKSDLSEIMHHGTVCVTQDTSIENYDPQHETGNGFVCPVKNAWSLFAEIIRAQVNYSFPYDWKQISQSAMDWSYKN